MGKQEPGLPRLAGKGVHDKREIKDGNPEEAENGIVRHQFLVYRHASLPRGKQPTGLRAIAGGHAAVVHDVIILVQAVDSFRRNVKRVLGFEDARPGRTLGMDIPHPVAKPSLLSLDVVMDFFRDKMAL